MKFITAWQAVEDDLAAIWVDAADRQAVADAANVIEGLLKHNPRTVGEAREGNTRVVIVHPLAVYYDVIVDDCRVVLWHDWRWSP